MIDIIMHIGLVACYTLLVTGAITTLLASDFARQPQSLRAHHRLYSFLVGYFVTTVSLGLANLAKPFLK